MNPTGLAKTGLGLVFVSVDYPVALTDSDATGKPTQDIVNQSGAAIV
jgi:hypothetical protein